jgi:soluble lytic murein transglycosylase-like protein
MRFLLSVVLAVPLLFAQATPPSPADALKAALEKQRASSALQNTSIRKQAENLGLWLPPGSDAPPAPPVSPVPPSPPDTAASATAAAGSAQPPPICDPLEEAAIAPIVDAAAKSNALEPRLLRAVIAQESAGRPCAVSPKGARGLMQLMPDTADDLGVKDVFDPRQNVDGGAKYLKQLLGRYAGDLSQALGAYNAGPGVVDEAGGIPNIRETRDYVSAILKRLSLSP